jgi:hypothetical protein
MTPEAPLKLLPESHPVFRTSKLMQTSEISVSSKESKAPKVIKSSSSSEMSKLA